MLFFCTVPACYGKMCASTAGLSAGTAAAGGICVKTDKREQKIIAILESRGELSVGELSDMLEISLSTLRKQLASMQARGLVIRTYGGVMSVNRVPDETFESKARKNIPEKRRIAARARALVGDGATVALGSGTTVYALAGLLDDLPRGTVYTNSMQAADALSRLRGLEVHISGGIVRRETGTVIGSETADYFRSLNDVDYAFIGCDAIDLSGGVYSENLSVAAVESTILMCAKHKYILCDPSKIGRGAVARICSLDVCDGLITCAGETDLTEQLKYCCNVIYA